MEQPTTEQKASANLATLKHIHTVQHFIFKIISALVDRANNHDRTKLEEPESDVFAVYTSKLSGLTFGSDEYKQCLKEMGVALEHHYAKNRHHPEHFKNGINDFNLVDLIEMFCDWKAASMRHNNGNLEKSIDFNQDRFHIPPKLSRIFKNTIAIIEEK